jgi:hypothetical protein
MFPSAWNTAISACMTQHVISISFSIPQISGLFQIWIELEMVVPNKNGWFNAEN